MQHIYGIRKIRNVDQAERAFLVPDPDFIDALTNCFHGLPVIGIYPPLNMIELIPRFTPRIGWKLLKVTS